MSDLVVGGVQQRVQVLQRCWSLVLEAGQQAALDGSELDRPLRQQVLVALSADAQLAGKWTQLAAAGTRFSSKHTCAGCADLEVLVHRQEVVLQGEGPAEALPEVFDSQFGEMLVESPQQLRHQQPHVLEAVALDPVTF